MTDTAHNKIPPWLICAGLALAVFAVYSPLWHAGFVAYDVNALPASIPLALRHFFRLPLLAWTVRTPEQRNVARSWADQIIFEGFDPDAG